MTGDKSKPAPHPIDFHLRKIREVLERGAMGANVTKAETEAAFKSCDMLEKMLKEKP